MRRRLRRAGLLGVLAGVAVALTGCADRTLAPGPILASPSSNHPVLTSTGLASVYAAAIRSFVGRPSGELYLYDFTCPDVVQAPATPDCAGTPMATEVGPAVVQLLTGWATVHVVSRGTAIPANASPTAHDSVVTFGPTRTHAGQIYLQVSYVCGGLCGQGATLIMAPIGAGWRVTGQIGPRWIS